MPSIGRRFLKGPAPPAIDAYHHHWFVRGRLRGSVPLIGPGRVLQSALTVSVKVCCMRQGLPAVPAALEPMDVPQVDLWRS